MLSSFLTVLSLLTLGLAATVQLGTTTIHGQDIPGLKQEFFGGIPYAEPPLGNLRFSPPVLKTSLDNHSFDASIPGPACLGIFGTANITQSEDCLTVNIYRPAGLSSSSKLPVMAWIYGSGFYVGLSSVYNASTLVAQSMDRGTPIIFVSFNYRVGPFGFPQGLEAERRGSLNLGIKDSLTALKWIQANIATFGGDKTKVTVFGESAGAISIGILYLNSGLEHLVRAAIFQSGSASSLPIFKPSDADAANWVNFVAAVPECSSVASSSNTFDCMRKASTSALLTAYELAHSQAKEVLPWLPSIDGPSGLIPDSPSKLFAEKRFSKIPFLTGTTLDEGTYFAPTTTNSSEAIRNIILANLGNTSSMQPVIDQLLNLYPDNPALGCPYNTGNETFGLSSQYKRLSAILGDLVFHSLRRLWIQSAANTGVQTFGYLFTDPAPSAYPPRLGVTHAVTAGYFFPGSLEVLFPGAELAPPAQSLSKQMMDYWISFATSLNPNDGKGGNRTYWPHYTVGHETLLQLDNRNLTVIPDDYRTKQIAYINSQAEALHH